MRWYRSFKIWIGFFLATVIASFLKLDFPISAGIITILNLLDTKKASVNVSIRRLISAFFGLIVMYILFELIGYNLVSLFIFVAIIAPLSFKFKAREGLVVNIVLASHLLIYHEVTVGHFMNEMMIVILGVVTGLVLSFHVPQKEEKIKSEMKAIDKSLRLNLNAISMSIKNLCHLDEDEFHIEGLIKRIKSARKLALEQRDNFYMTDYSYYYEYFQLRLNQAHRIRYMKERLNHVFINQSQATILSDFIDELADVFDPKNDGLKLMEELEVVKDHFSNLPLPDSREAFNEQSALFQLLYDLEEFIKMKIRYVSRNKSQLLS